MHDQIRGPDSIAVVITRYEQQHVRRHPLVGEPTAPAVARLVDTARREQPATPREVARTLTSLIGYVCAACPWLLSLDLIQGLG